MGGCFPFHASRNLDLFNENCVGNFRQIIKRKITSIDTFFFKKKTPEESNAAATSKPQEKQTKLGSIGNEQALSRSLSFFNFTSHVTYLA